MEHYLRPVTRLLSAFRPSPIAIAQYLAFSLASAAKRDNVLQSRLIEIDQLISAARRSKERRRYKWIRRLVVRDIQRCRGEMEALLRAVDSCRMQMEEMYWQQLGHRQ